MSSIEEKLNLYSKAYYEGNPLISDYEYDMLLEQYNSDYNFLEGEDGKIKLPYYMGSLDKIKQKDKQKFNQWNSNGEELVIMDKIDGVSALYHKGKLYSRGNGNYGRDISHFLVHLNLPKIPDNVSVRGELAISENAFHMTDYMDPRSMVAGLANSGESNPNIKFYAFAVYSSNNLSFRDQLIFIYENKFDRPWLTVISDLKFETLHDILETRKRKQGLDNYLIDGIVLAQNKSGYPNNGNPKHIIAYKENESAIITEVTEVIWQVSKYGKLVPVINFNQVFHKGVIISKATGHNANYILTNNIGVGTKVAVVRSGEVIPYIAYVVKSTQADMPKQDYYWKGMHIYLSDKEEFKLETFQGFVQGLEIKDLGPKRIEKLFNSGLTQILELPKEDLVEVFGQKIGSKIFDNIQISLKQLTKAKILVISGAFKHGFGINRAKLLLEHNPDLSVDFDGKIEGFGEVVISQVKEGIPKFYRWLQTQPTLLQFWTTQFDDDDEKKDDYEPEEPVGPDIYEDCDLSDHVFLFTGFTNKELKREIEKYGGKVKDSFTKDVNILLVKNKNFTSAKVKKAISLNILIMTLEDFLSEKCFLKRK